MPIVIKEAPEPLTHAAQTTEPILAGCDAYRALLHDIQRYGKRETMGRSLLISGHRGAGKTTLVRWAIQVAQKELGKSNEATRPLLVALHGPDLLGGEAVLSSGRSTAEAKPAPAQTETKPDATSAQSGEQSNGHKELPPKPPAPQPGEKPAEKSADEFSQNTRAALQMLTQALHRAYINELGKAFSECVQENNELRELAAQLLVELDHAPSLDMLRFVWQAAGGLETGVLFRDRDKGQGLRELVAASIATEAFQRLAGKLEGTQGSTEQSEIEQKLERKSDWSGKDLFNPLIGIVSGGAAGAAVITSSVSAGAKPLIAALASIVTAIASTTALNYSSSRSRKSGRERKVSFTWDTSIASLDRLLPVMVERIVDAGLAPIFVIDELDKVPDIEHKMENLIRHLKHLVTEKTFFCFLADRRYFEHVVATSRSTVYGKEYTFFSDRLFVHYRPEDLHTYLGAILSKEQIANDNERDDLLVLPFFLLGRAKMHPIDLRRTLYDIADDKAQIDIPPGEIRAPGGYVMTIFMQAAVELVLHDKDMRSRLRQDPNFSRLAYDALYLPSRSWERGDEMLVLTREHLKKALEARIAADGNAEETRGNLSASDLDLLHTSLKRLVEFLREPGILVKELLVKRDSPEPVNDRFREDGWNAVRRLISSDLQLLGHITEEETAWWLYDQFGIRRPQSPTPVTPKPAEEQTPEPEADTTVTAHAATEEAPDDNKEEIEETTGALSGKKALAGDAAQQITKALEADAADEILKDGSTEETSEATPVKSKRNISIAEHIGFIQDLDSLLRLASGERLDLDRLASQIQLLGLSPAWPSVEMAMRTLEPSAGSMATTGAAQSAESIIESYARMLDTAWPAIRRAMALAVVLANAMPGSNSARKFDAALRMLAADLRFGKIEMAKCIALLTQLDLRAKDFGRELNVRAIEELFGISGSEFQPWKNKFVSLMMALAVATPILVSPKAIAEHQNRWKYFFSMRFRRGDSVFIPAFEDLLLRAQGAALPMETELNEMTYLKYAEVLSYLAGMSEDPLLLQAILIELGFSKEVSARITTSEQISSSEIEMVELCNLARVQKNGERVLLAIGGSPGNFKVSPEGDVLEIEKRGAGSVTVNWRISQQHAVLPFFATESGRVLDANLRFVVPTLIFSEKRFPINTEVWTSNAPNFQLRPPESGPGPLTLVAPPDLDAAVADAKKQLGPLPPAPFPPPK